MVVIVIETWWPAGKAKEVAKKVIEVTKEFPEDKTLAKRVLACARASKDGINGLTAWEVKSGKLEEALIRVGTAALRYAEIEGYQYDIKTYVTDIEAFSMINMKPPA